MVGMTEPTARVAATEPSSKRPVELYKIAMDEGRRALDDQLDELSGIRNRAVQFNAFVGAATAFLAGVGLRTGTNIRDALFFGLAGTASLVSLAALACLALVIAPRRKAVFETRSSPGVILGWIDNDVPRPTEAAMLRGLAKQYEGRRSRNEVVLGHLRRLYVWTILLGGFAVLAWGVVAWHGGAA